MSGGTYAKDMLNNQQWWSRPVFLEQQISVKNDLPSCMDDRHNRELNTEILSETADTSTLVGWSSLADANKCVQLNTVIILEKNSKRLNYVQLRHVTAYIVAI